MNTRGAAREGTAQHKRLAEEGSRVPADGAEKRPRAQRPPATEPNPDIDFAALQPNRAPARKSRARSVSPAPKDQPKIKRSRSASPVPNRSRSPPRGPRKPKLIAELRKAVSLHVLEKNYGHRAAAAAVNMVCPAIKSGEAAEISKQDVERYSEPYKKMLENDVDLAEARAGLSKARELIVSKPHDEDAKVALRVAEGVFTSQTNSARRKIQNAIAEMQLKVNGNKEWQERRVFGDGDEKVVAAFIEHMSKAGFPFGVDMVKDMLADMARQMNIDDFVASEGFMSGFKQRTGNTWGARKASAVDPKRAKAADPKIADEMFRRGEEFYARLREADPVRWPWATLRDMPKERIFNFDEAGDDANKRRGKVYASKDLERGGLHRVFEITLRILDQ